jgi:hypothetical protein
VREKNKNKTKAKVGQQRGVYLQAEDVVGRM